MISSDIHSVTDLRNNGKEILDHVQTRPQFIMKNNKMVGVVISPADYDEHFGDNVFTDEMKNKYEQFVKDRQKGETFTHEQVKAMFDV